MTMPEILRRKLMERIDIASEPDDGEVLEEIDGLILGEEETRYLPVAQKAELRRQLFYSVRRLDVLQELLEDAAITEIMVNGYQHIFVERNGRIERYGKSFTSAEKLEDVIQQIVGRCNRVVNEQNPIVDARLENGDRVNVVMKPVALNGPILTIRRFPEQAVTMEFLVSIGSITKEAAEFLQALVRTRYSMMIGGATGSGKTTFLNVLSAYIPKGERIITIEDNAELQIQGVENLVRLKYILDVRDFSGSPDAALFTKSIDTILNDPEIKVVVETIGGTKFAYPYVRQCLESGRSVCTSNKEMVATYGAELLALAKEHSAAFLFEASVGGGTPIITPMHQCLAANHISSIRGIVNGTTNFMLTKMKRENMGFDEALKIAQQLGYAETRDPGDDVDGRDACRKIAILASLACGHHVYPDNIPTRGIRDITVADIKAAEKLDSAIKLIAWYNEGGDGQMAAGVEPMLVSNSNQLAGVDDVFNAVLMKGDMLGDVVFYGKGAGKLPTASAVVADVIDALKEGVKVHDSLFWKPAEKPEGLLEDRNTYPWYLRVTGVAAALLPSVAGAGHVVFEDNGEAAYLVEAATSADIAAVTEKIEVLGGKVALAMKKLED